MKTRTGLTFTLQNVGMFLHSLLLHNQKNPYTYKYRFKKKLYSFVFPNEIRNAIMSRKKRIIYYRLVFKTKHFSKARKYFSTTAFNKELLSNYRSQIRNTANETFLSPELFALRTNESSSHVSLLKYENNFSSRDEILYERTFNFRGADTTFKRAEVRIPRIRFRPGYQRI